jgi:hypothetical protein
MALKIAELREELAKRGLGTSGQKAELRTRLTAAVEEEARQAVRLSERLTGNKRNGDFISPPMDGTKRARATTCKVMKTCKKYLEELGLDPSYFDDDFDRCYCDQCGATLPPLITQGDEKYELPLGWCGFGLAVPARAKALDIFNEWHVCYHGTSPKHLSSILAEGGLLMPGDTLLNGETLGALHTRDASRHKIYTSPSILYSELDVYTGKFFSEGQRVRVVLQCKQQPNYSTCSETVGWNRKHPNTPISPYFENSVIERITQSKNSVIPYRILVKQSSLFKEPKSQVGGPLTIRLSGAADFPSAHMVQGLYVRMNMFRSEGVGNRPVYRSTEHEGGEACYLWYCPSTQHWIGFAMQDKVGTEKGTFSWQTHSATPVSAGAKWKHFIDNEWKVATGMRFESCSSLTIHIKGLPSAHPRYETIVGDYTQCAGDLVNGAPVYCRTGEGFSHYLWHSSSGTSWMMSLDKSHVGADRGNTLISTDTKRDPWLAMSECQWAFTLPQAKQKTVEWAPINAGTMSVEPTSKFPYHH